MDAIEKMFNKIDNQQMRQSKLMNRTNMLNVILNLTLCSINTGNSAEFVVNRYKEVSELILEDIKGK